MCHKWQNECRLFRCEMRIFSFPRRYVKMPVNAVSRRKADVAPGEEPGGHYSVYQPFNRPSLLPFILVAARRNRNSYFCGLSIPRERIYNNKKLLVAQPLIGILDCGGRRSFVDRLEMNPGESRGRTSEVAEISVLINCRGSLRLTIETKCHDASA